MAITPPSTPPSPSSPVQNNLSDIFSDSPPSTPHQSSDPSDIPRLRSTHATAGYRAGISTSKLRSLQPGFDEGYSLGAVFGLQVGYILGVLEGLWSSYKTQRKQKDRLWRLFKQAKEELEIGRMFDKGYWDKNGVWTYEVTTEAGEPSFQEVAEQHPIIKKWNDTARAEIDRAGIKMGRFEGREWEAGRMGDEINATERPH